MMIEKLSLAAFGAFVIASSTQATILADWSGGVDWETEESPTPANNFVVGPTSAGSGEFASESSAGGFGAGDSDEGEWVDDPMGIDRQADPGTYIEFRLPTTGFTDISISGLASSNNDVTMTAQASLDGFSTIETLGTLVLVPNQFESFNFDLSSTFDDQSSIAIRLTILDGLFFRFLVDDVVVEGVPAPGAASLLGLAGLAATRRRR